MSIKIRAVTFDAYGTILHLKNPFERLMDQLLGIGLRVPLEAAKEAFIREMGYYKEHHLEGVDHETLLMLRHRCVGALFRDLAKNGYQTEVAADRKLEVLMNSIRFQPFDDVVPVLNWCESKGLMTGVISNWDCSLPEILEDRLNRHRFDLIMVSAIEGMDKSDPEIYHQAAKRFELSPSRILHIGDEIDNDLYSPQKAGLHAVLLDRDGRQKDANAPFLRTLTDLPLMIESQAYQRP